MNKEIRKARNAEDDHYRVAALFDKGLRRKSGIRRNNLSHDQGVITNGQRQHLRVEQSDCERAITKIRARYLHLGSGSGPTAEQRHLRLNTCYLESKLRRSREITIDSLKVVIVKLGFFNAPCSAT
jgi:hypothetical protein